MNLRILSFLLILILSNTALITQTYQGKACRNANPSLKKFFKKKSLVGLSLDAGTTGAWSMWSSSFLKNTAKLPKRSVDYDASIDGDLDKHSWSCRYSAMSAQDGKTRTGWSEGVKGNGIGEIVITPVNTQKVIKIWGGLGRSLALFKANNRPKKVKVYFLDARKVMATQVGMIYTDLHIVGSHVQTLRDYNGFQPLGRPKHSIQGRSLIAIEILSVYPGSRWPDTVISEVMN